MADQPRVAKRKTHTKSRKGCFQCKQRHTKCNEDRPRCANCVRLDISCTWPSVTNSYPTSNQSPESQPSPSLDGGTPVSTEIVPKAVFELSIPDMRLLHHWTAKGYKAMHPCLSLRSDAWGSGIIEIGFEYPFVLHGVLALSAVHKASFLIPSERQSLLLQADVHISQALETMRKNLEAPRPEMSIPMFVLSSVLLTYNFGCVQEMPDDPIGSVHHCFMLLNGIKLVIGPYWDRITDCPALFDIVEMSAPSTIQKLTMLSKDDEYPEILRLMELTELLLDTQDKVACADAINELHIIAVCSRHIPPDRDQHPFLFYWAARISNRFFDLLAHHNPVACIVTVHFATLLAQDRPVWWVVKWPRYLLGASEQLLAKTPDLLRWLEWPQGIINNAPMSATTTPAVT